jgi:hypothetical protein
LRLSISLRAEIRGGLVTTRLVEVSCVLWQQSLLVQPRFIFDMEQPQHPHFVVSGY